MTFLFLLAAIADPVGAQVADQMPVMLIDAGLARLEGERPGCVAGIVERGGLGRVRIAGLADLESRRPITAATPFNIASMSKQFTAAAAALLIGEDRLGLDDDVRRYLPELRDYGHVIRIRDLLQHSSGLRNHMALAAFQPGSGLPSNAEALALVFRQSGLNFRPGTRHQYESPNYVLLAEIVARIEGAPFGEVLQRRIFAPLGMTRTGFAVDGAARAYNARPDGSFVLNERVNQARGSSGLYSTVEDLAKWLAALGDGRFGGSDFLARMTSGGRLADGTRLSYGYGLSVTPGPAGTPDALMIGHGGQTAAYRSTFSYFPARRYGVVMLCNVSDAPLAVAEQAVRAWRAANNLTPPEPAAATALPAADVAQHAGHYRDPETDLVRSFTVADGALALLYFGQAIPLTPAGGGRFTLDDDISFTFADGAVVAREPNQPPVRFVRLPAAPGGSAAAFAGRYRTDDLDSVLALRADGADLLLTLKGNEVRLRPLSPDGFAAPEADFQHVAFLRDGRGRVTGLTLTTGSGINRMRFERLPG